MKETWEKAIKFVLEAEGGNTITEHSDDPGGLTKYGISQRAFPTLNIRDLTEDEAKAIYKRDYWDKCNCDNLGYPLDMCVFDAAVNTGVTAALSMLENINLSWEHYLLNRVSRYIKISAKNPSMKAFFRGWIIRINNLFSSINGGA